MLFQHGTAKQQLLIQKVERDPKQNLLGCYDELKLIVEFYSALKGKIYCQYRDSCDMEWPF